MSNDDFDSLSADKWIDRVCDVFERTWLDRKQADIEPVVANVPPQHRRRLLLQLIGIDIEYRKRFRVPLGAQEYIDQFPELTLTSVEALFENTEALRNEASITSTPKTARPGSSARSAPSGPTAGSSARRVCAKGESVSRRVGRVVSATTPSSSCLMAEHWPS